MRSISRNSAEELLSLKEKPTAIFAASDVMAMEAIDVAKNKGIKVPKDLSVFGFDDFPMNIYSSVHLSTVSQPLEEMGRLGVEALNQIVSKKIPAPFKKVLKAKIIKRESCVKAS
jgi:DNA-binding LacI/PurR family transcriptional regulator